MCVYIYIYIYISVCVFVRARRVVQAYLCVVGLYSVCMSDVICCIWKSNENIFHIRSLCASAHRHTYYSFLSSPRGEIERGFSALFLRLCINLTLFIYSFYVAGNVFDDLPFAVTVLL